MGLISAPVSGSTRRPLDDRRVGGVSVRGAGGARIWSCSGLKPESNWIWCLLLSLRSSNRFGLRSRSPSQAFKARLGFLQPADERRLNSEHSFPFPSYSHHHVQALFRHKYYLLLYMLICIYKTFYQHESLLIFKVTYTRLICVFMSS